MATTAEFDELLRIAFREATDTTTHLVQQLGMAELAGWTLDEAKGQLLFAAVNRKAVIVTAQVVSTYETATRRFEWGWNDAGFTAPVTWAARQARGWGAVNEIKLLTDPVHNLDDTTAWRLAAFTARLVGWPGIYRGTGIGPKEIFLAFTPLGTEGWTAPPPVVAPPDSMSG